MPQEPTSYISTISRVVGGGLIALFCALIIAALTFFGIINATLGHVSMGLAWFVGSLLICGEILPGKPTRHKVWSVVGLGAIILLGDLGMARLKKHQDELASPSHDSGQPLSTQPIPPPAQTAPQSENKIPTTAHPQKEADVNRLAEEILKRIPKPEPPPHCMDDGTFSHCSVAEVISRCRPMTDQIRQIDIRRGNRLIEERRRLQIPDTDGTEGAQHLRDMLLRQSFVEANDEYDHCCRNKVKRCRTELINRLGGPISEDKMNDRFYAEPEWDRLQVAFVRIARDLDTLCDRLLTQQ